MQMGCKYLGGFHSETPGPGRLSEKMGPLRMVAGNMGKAQAQEPFIMGLIGLEPIECLQSCLSALPRKAAVRGLVWEAQLSEGHP